MHMNSCFQTYIPYQLLGFVEWEALAVAFEVVLCVVTQELTQYRVIHEKCKRHILTYFT